MTDTTKTETKADRIAYLEGRGLIVPGCPGCKPTYDSEDGRKPFGPNHKASERCRSGKRDHCTCDTCF